MHLKSKTSCRVPHSLAEACRTVAAGGVVVYPTETLWGLGGDATSRPVVERIARIKRIDAVRPFPVLAATVAAAVRAASPGLPRFEELVRTFWPGGLTLAVPVRLAGLAHMMGPDGTVGLRVSANRQACELAVAAGGFLVSTSANLTGSRPPACLAEVSDEILSQVDGVVGSEATVGGAASTVLLWRGGAWEVRRVGAVPAEELRRVLGELLR
jgi:L-threonylcarbamoyladenylate synthase